MRFGDREATLANARLCYGPEALEGYSFAIFADHVGWGWSALEPVPVRAVRDHGRAGLGRPQRTRPENDVQPVAKKLLHHT